MTHTAPLAILSAPGTRGDVNPMVAIGRELKTHGYDVAISLAEPYAEVARKAGLEVHPVIGKDRLQAVLSDPSIWKLLRGMRKVVRGIAVDYIRPHFDLIRRLHRPGQTILVSHPLDFASRVYRDIDPETPLIDVHLAPVMLRTPSDPVHLTPWLFEPTRHRFTFRIAYWIGDALILDRFLGGEINRLLRANHCSPVRRVMNHWWLSPDQILLMYPEWYAPATAGFLPQMRHIRFPLDDAPLDSFALPSDRPVVFTGGSANYHTHKFFERCVSVCRSLGVPGVLMTSHRDCVPKTLPSNVRRLGYVPYSELLPVCRAVVHHGGVGTTAQALRAGTPQLVRPLAFDQFDNARRVKELGCGQVLHRDRNLEGKLDVLLGSEVIAENARKVAHRFETSQSAAALAAQTISDFVIGRIVKV